MAEMLTPYATEYRYPGNFVEPERAEAKQALAMAEAFVNFVIGVLPLEVASAIGGRDGSEQNRSLNLKDCKFNQKLGACRAWLRIQIVRRNPVSYSEATWLIVQG